MNVSVCVQHHPDRAHLLPALLRRLPRGTEVVTDPDPGSTFRSPLRTYMACLEGTPADATHRVVIQDDAMPVPGFSGKMRKAIRERPDDLVCLFAPGAGHHRVSVLRAAQAGERWARLPGGWVPLVAAVWPSYRAREFLDWLIEHRYDPHRRHRGDDGPAGTWAMKRRVVAWALVPSIVEHPDVEPSLIGRRAGHGKNRARIAAVLDA